MLVLTRKRTKVGAFIVKRLVVFGSYVSKRGIVKGYTRRVVLEVSSDIYT